MNLETLKKIQSGFYFLLGLALVFSISGTYIIGGIIILFILMNYWGAARIKPKHKFSSSLDIPLVIYFLLGLISALIMKSTSISKAFSSQIAIVLFFLVAHFSDLGQVKKLIFGFVLASSMAGLWGGIQILSGVHFNPDALTYRFPPFLEGWPQWIMELISDRNGRAVGSRSHPLTYAEGLIPAFLFFVSGGLMGFIKKGTGQFKDWKWIIGMVLVSVGLVAAQGRAVWLGCGLGLLIVLWQFPKKIRYSFGIFLLLAGAVLIFISPQLKGRVLSIFVNQTARPSDQESKSVRWVLWKSAAQEIQKHPVWGAGHRGTHLKISHPSAGSKKNWSETHNIFLQSAVERGVVGLGVLIWILILAGKLCFSWPSPWKGLMGGIFMAFMMAGLTESWLRDQEVAMIFWTVMGLAQFGLQNPDLFTAKESS